MQNDMLKNTIAPWQEKGRWYHGVYDISTNAFNQAKTDKLIIDTCNVVQAGAYLLLGPNGQNTKLKILDVKSDISAFSTGGSTLYFGVHALTGIGSRRVSIAPLMTSGIIEFWVFIVKN